jgi:hypothetical protein
VSPSLQEQIQLALGQTYALERELGGGGMSRVFVAHERALGRKVVVKVLLPELAAGVNVERFRREIQLAAQLQHPHIVPLLAAGEADGLPYLIMPFVSGESLRARISREGEFPIFDTVRILRDVVSGLAYAHGFGVIHRDVKPDNVLLSHGVAVVTDFGVAKAISASSGQPQSSGITSVGVALGTPAYMAPEQATGSPNIDHRADIYALGAMAYELLTGTPPFAGRTAQAVLAAHVVEEPEPVERRRPAVPPMLANLVRECLCKRPADRPQSAAQIINTLDAIVTPSSGTAATTVVRMPAAPRPRRRGAWLVGSGVAGALILGALVLLLGRHRETGVAATSPAPLPKPDSVTVVARAPATDSVELPTRSPAVAEAKPSPPKPRTRRSATPAPAVPPPAEDSAVPPPIGGNLGVVGAPAALPKSAVSALPPDTAPAESSRAAEAPRITVPAPGPPRPEAPPPPVDQRPALQAAVAEYAAAIEARDIAAIRRAYPGMTEAQQRGWEQFFQVTRDVKAKLRLPQVQVSGATAEGVVAGSYTYLNTSNGQMTTQPVTFRASFRADNGRWRLVAVR